MADFDDLLAVPPGEAIKGSVDTLDPVSKAVMDSTPITDYDDLLAIPPGEADKPVVPPTLKQQETKPLIGIVDYAATNLGVGIDNVIDGFKYVEAAKGHKTFEEVEAELADQHKRTNEKISDLERFESANFSDENINNFQRSAPSIALKMIATGGLAPTNEVSPALIRFGLESPGVALQSAPMSGVTLAGGVVAGVPTGGIGFVPGAIAASAYIMYGMAYRDLRRAKLSHKLSSQLALFAAIPQAAIEQMQMRQIMKLGKKEYDAVVKSPEFKRTMKGEIYRTLKELNKQGTEEVIQDLMYKAVETFGTYIEKGKLPTIEETLKAVHELAKSYKGGVQGGIGGGAASKAAGASLGAAHKAFREIDGKKSLNEQEAMDALLKTIEEANEELPVTEQTETPEPKLKARIEKFDMEARLEKLQRDLTACIDGVTGTLQKKPLDALNDIHKFIVQTKRVGFMKGMFAPQPALVGMALQHAPTNHEAFKILRLDQESRREAANVHRQSQKLIQAITQGDRRMLDVIARGTKEKNREWAAQDADGRISNVTVKATDNELIQLYLQFDDQILHKGLRSTGYTFKGEVAAGTSTQEYIEQTLTDDQKLLASRLRDWYREYYERINDHYNIENGKDMVRRDNYSGRARREGFENQAPYTEFLKALQFENDLTPSSTKSRTNSKLALKKIDAFANAVDSIDDFEHWIAYSDKARTWDYIKNDQMFKKAFVSKFGEGLYDRLVYVNDRIIGTVNPQRTPYDGILSMIKQNAAMFVAGNPLQYLKQRGSGAIAFTGYMNPVKFANYVDDYYENYEEAQNVMKDSDFLTARRENVSPELKQVLRTNSGFDRYPNGFTWNKFLSSPSRLADLHSIHEGYWALYKDARDNKRMSHRQAIEYADAICDSTQSSGLKGQKSAVELSGVAGESFSQFTKQPNQLEEEQANAIRRAISNPTRENVMNAVGKVTAFRASQASFRAVGSAYNILMASVLSSGSDDDEKKVSDAWYVGQSRWIRDWILGSSTGRPVIGQLGETILTTASNYISKDSEGKGGVNERSFTPNLIAIDSAIDLAELSSKSSEHMADFMLFGKQITTNEWIELADLAATSAVFTKAPAARSLTAGRPFIRTMRLFFPAKDAKDVQPEEKQPIQSDMLDLYNTEPEVEDTE